MEILLLVLYVAALLYLVVNNIVQARLAWHFFRRRRQPKPAELSLSDWPLVTVQLPVYNEKYVVEPLLRAIAALDYPNDRLQIQVLDDSTDETTWLIDRQLPAIRQRGFAIEHIRRADRTGFKAGALNEGLKTATGEFITIFDADFQPAPDFLKRLLSYFNQPDVGLVQARWDHLNLTDSWLTRFQGFFLDAHLFVEQWGRNAAGHLINFNGTAGIWRKICIEDSGGWHTDTLTEDMDLSYRAQLRGWRFTYAGEVGVPAELPVSMHALKAQQFRWMKGIAETARHHLWPVLRSSRLGLQTKGYALIHLLSSLPFCCFLVVGIISVPMLWFLQQPAFARVIDTVSWLAMLTVASMALYWAGFSYRQTAPRRSVLTFLKHYVLLMVVSMGLCYHNACAVFEGLLGKRSAFQRTPKFNRNAQPGQWQANQYLQKQRMALPFAEIVLCLYFLAGIGLAVHLQNFGLVPLHLPFAVGFGLISYRSIAETYSVKLTTGQPLGRFQRLLRWYAG